eukprot:CAMPEP_0179282792 /NCGR_PEP_ID=MMETSP0797-20121207/37844_1 /TAXON_ID=47934 /ORGANISM="Dinophysis acuminata, Strain DAEP01" /LENGTH=47 /DNA_ID= /DNA_START= /DNA_END= /DNA_ORIENTATION=
MTDPASPAHQQHPSNVGDSDLDFDTRLDRDGGDLLHNVRGRVQVDEA